MTPKHRTVEHAVLAAWHRGLWCFLQGVEQLEDSCGVGSVPVSLGRSPLFGLLVQAARKVALSSAVDLVLEL